MRNRIAAALAVLVALNGVGPSTPHRHEAATHRTITFTSNDSALTQPWDALAIHLEHRAGDSTWARVTAGGRDLAYIDRRGQTVDVTVRTSRIAAAWGLTTAQITEALNGTGGFDISDPIRISGPTSEWQLALSDVDLLPLWCALHSSHPYPHPTTAPSCSPKGPDHLAPLPAALHITNDQQAKRDTADPSTAPPVALSAVAELIHQWRTGQLPALDALAVPDRPLFDPQNALDTALLAAAAGNDPDLPQTAHLLWHNGSIRATYGPTERCLQFDTPQPQPGPCSIHTHPDLS